MLQVALYQLDLFNFSFYQQSLNGFSLALANAFSHFHHHSLHHRKRRVRS
jgi:hypothetical protein